MTFLQKKKSVWPQKNVFNLDQSKRYKATQIQTIEAYLPGPGPRQLTSKTKLCKTTQSRLEQPTNPEQTNQRPGNSIESSDCVNAAVVSNARYSRPPMSHIRDQSPSCVVQEEKCSKLQSVSVVQNPQNDIFKLIFVIVQSYSLFSRIQCLQADFPFFSYRCCYCYFNYFICSLLCFGCFLFYHFLSFFC